MKLLLTDIEVNALLVDAIYDKYFSGNTAFNEKYDVSPASLVIVETADGLEVWIDPKTPTIE